MKLYDLEDYAQSSVSQDTANTTPQQPRSFDDAPVFDKGNFGKSKKKLFDSGDLM